MSYRSASRAREGIDNGARRVYVHYTPDADGSNPGSGWPAAAAESRAQARNVSAFCFARSRPLDGAVDKPHRRPGPVEWVLGVGIASGELLVDVNAETRFVVRPHHAVVDL